LPRDAFEASAHLSGSYPGRPRINIAYYPTTLSLATTNFLQFRQEEMVSAEAKQQGGEKHKRWQCHIQILLQKRRDVRSNSDGLSFPWRLDRFSQSSIRPSKHTLKQSTSRMKLTPASALNWPLLGQPAGRQAGARCWYGESGI
jgi:hypothetical protein